MMKKMIVLWLLLLVWGGALVRAQVRIGGSGDPNAAAVLDLNADNAATPAGNKGALALPRINLSSVSATLNGAAPLNGMLVYHTGSTLSGEGVYVWTGSQWMKVNAGSLTITNGMIAANAIDSTKIINGTVGLEDIRDGIISNAKLMNGTITGAKITNATIDSTKIVTNTIGVTRLKDGAVTGAKIATNTIPLNRIYTVAADSGSFMFSNGINWRISKGFTFTQDSTSVSMPASSDPVTWTKVLDVVVKFDLQPHQYVLIRAPSVSIGDYCSMMSTGIVVLEANAGAVHIAPVGFTTATVSNGRLRCYHPSL